MWNADLRSLALLVAVLPSPGGLAAQSVKLNGALAEPWDGDVTSYLLSPDGTRVVYRADVTADFRYELFTVPVDRSTPPRRLNAPLPAGGRVAPAIVDGPELDRYYAIGASNRVVYVADQLTQGLFQLFTVPIDASAPPVLLSDPGLSVGRPWLRADGQEVFYYSGGMLRRVPIDGSAAPFPFLQAGSAWTSPDGALAVYEQSIGGGQMRLLVVATDGISTPIELAQSGPPIDIGFTTFDDVAFTPDGERIVYYVLRDEDGDGYSDLYSVPLDASEPPVQLNPVPQDLYFRGFQLGAEHVLYTHGAIRFDGTGFVQIPPPGAYATSNRVLSADGLGTWVRTHFLSTPEVDGVYFAALDGTVFQRVGLDAPGAGGFTGTLTVRDPSLAAYVGTHTGGFRGITAVPLDLDAPTLLNGPPTADRGASFMRFHPDGESALFLGDQMTDERQELYVVPLDASLAPRRLNAPMIGSGDVRSFELAADGAYAVYHADAEHDETFDLFSARVDGSSPPVRFNPSLQVGIPVGDVTSFLPTSDGQRAVYRADADEDNEHHLFAVWSDGHGAPLRLTANTWVTEVIDGFALSQSGQRVVFQDQLGTARTLASAPTSSAGAPVALDGPNPGYLAPFAFDAGGRLVYRVNVGGGASVLRSVPADGSAPALTLFDPPGSLMVREHALDPAGDTAVFRADVGAGFATDLFSVPSDGSAAPVQLNPPLIAGAAVAAFRIVPDSTRVVFRGDTEVDGEQELFVRPLDGSGAVLQLSGSLVAGGDVGEFQLAADALRAVYRADQTSDEVFELHGVPLDASTPPVRLNAVPVAGGDVAADFVLASGRAVYRADQDADEVFELYSVPDDGSAAPVKLSGALTAGGDVSAFALSPDGSRVVYLADQRADEVVEPFSAPADGSGPAVALHLLPSFADASAFRIAPDSASVTWLVDASANAVFELFSAPLDGGTPPRRVSRILTPGGDVEDDFVPLSGGRVLYRADAEAFGVLELFCFLNLGDERPAQGGRELRGPRSVER